ncbi:MAG: DUF4279 domain-containing protein [Myxococcota bacterium]
MGQRPARVGSLLEAGGPIDSVCVTLAIYGESLNPDAITERLGVTPTTSYRRGDPRRGAGMPPHRGGGWFIERVGDAPQTPESLTMSLLEPLPPSRAEIWAELAQHFDVQLHVALYLYSFNRGFSFSRDLSWHLAAMRARVVFDVYASSS